MCAILATAGYSGRTECSNFGATLAGSCPASATERLNNRKRTQRIIDPENTTMKSACHNRPKTNGRQWAFAFDSRNGRISYSNGKAPEARRKEAHHRESLFGALC